MQQNVDSRARIEDDLIEAIVKRVLERLDGEFRERALKVREAKLADLRSFELTHGLPRAIVSQRDGIGAKASDKYSINKGSNRER